MIRKICASKTELIRKIGLFLWPWCVLSYWFYILSAWSFCLIWSFWYKKGYLFWMYFLRQYSLMEPSLFKYVQEPFIIGMVIKWKQVTYYRDYTIGLVATLRWQVYFRICFSWRLVIKDTWLGGRKYIANHQPDTCHNI